MTAPDDHEGGDGSQLSRRTAIARLAIGALVGAAGCRRRSPDETAERDEAQVDVTEAPSPAIPNVEPVIRVRVLRVRDGDRRVRFGRENQWIRMHRVDDPTADTVVSVDGRCLGKPIDREEAERFFELLGGRTHEVWTGLVFVPVAGGVIDRANVDRIAVVAEVAMRALESDELAEYFAGDDWRDKAGGYAIQGAAGRFATLTSGELETVIGLPMGPVLDHWRGFLG